jgi:hypothetical protein
VSERVRERERETDRQRERDKRERVRESARARARVFGAYSTSEGHTMTQSENPPPHHLIHRRCSINRQRERQRERERETERQRDRERERAFIRSVLHNGGSRTVTLARDYTCAHTH